MILRNLYLHNAPSKKDLVELQYSTNVWIDHNDFSSNGITGSKDAYDGLLDITHVRRAPSCPIWAILDQADRKNRALIKSLCHGTSSTITGRQVLFAYGRRHRT